MKLLELLFEPDPATRLRQYAEFVRCDGCWKPSRIFYYKDRYKNYFSMDDIEKIAPRLKNYVAYYRKIYKELDWLKKRYFLQNLLAGEMGAIPEGYTAKLYDLSRAALMKNKEFASALEQTAIELVQSHSHGRI